MQLHDSTIAYDVRVDVSRETDLEQLCQLAENGQPRPAKNSKLGRRLAAVTSPTCYSFRPGFKNLLISLGAAHWFNDTRANSFKDQILKLAQRGLKRPKPTTTLGMRLAQYLDPNGLQYDPKLKNQIIDHGGAGWFRDTTSIMDELRELARIGAPRPHYTTPLGRKLSQYVSPSSTIYRHGFREELISIGVSHWFNATIDNHPEMIAVEQLAATGAPRPAKNTRLGKWLTAHTRNGTALRSRLISMGARHWFPNVVTHDQMEELRKLAREGHPRPYYASRLGIALKNYIGRGNASYRNGFQQELFSLGATDWFS